jgi:hypothetical protein
VTLKLDFESVTQIPEIGTNHAQALDLDQSKALLQSIAKMVNFYRKVSESEVLFTNRGK